MIPAANIIPFFVAIPLAGAFLTSLIARKLKWLSDFVGSLTTLILLVLSILAVYVTNIHGTLVYSVGGWKLPVGIAMVLDGLTSFMLVTVNLLAFVIAI